jgi:putative peptidoglycan lipid II flippase
LIINIVSVGLSYFFLNFLDNQWVTVGLGVAFSISYLVGLWVTLALLKKHIGVLRLREFAGQHLRLFVAAFLAMLPLFAIVEYMSWSGFDLTSIQRAGQLLAVMVLAMIAFIFAGKAVGVQEISMIRHLSSSITRRKSGQE